MTKFFVFSILLMLASTWLMPYTQIILQAKGTFIYFFTSHSIPIGWLGFSAIFTAVWFGIVYGFLKFFLK